ncbi:MAG TPA: hypothetical protein PJ994_08590 [Tepidiformaceae bacterium]|nr:hypothetical protein [Tepidiformaceae bacterium]
MATLAELDSPVRTLIESVATFGDAEFATLTPPNDVHAHGHVPGIGSAAYILVLTGRPQVQFERQEYNLERGTWRTLAPGDMGSPGQAL